ncbi:hypothetical protein MMRN_26650 [Mycobacterium marinum]|nr:hypothetical protein MMRN_26650 [Mycobacterium marinum]
MSPWKRPSATAAIAALAFTALPQVFAVMAPSGAAQADVCVNAGRRVSVSGCANIADAIAPYVPPPAEYAPLPEDYPPPRRRPQRECVRQCRQANQRQRLRIGRVAAADQPAQ